MQILNTVIPYSTIMGIGQAYGEDDSFSNTLFEPGHEISNNMVCAISKASDQPAHTRSLIRAFACHLNIHWVLSY